MRNYNYGPVPYEGGSLTWRGLNNNKKKINKHKIIQFYCPCFCAKSLFGVKVYERTKQNKSAGYNYIYRS